MKNLTTGLFWAFLVCTQPLLAQKNTVKVIINPDGKALSLERSLNAIASIQAEYWIVENNNASKSKTVKGSWDSNYYKGSAAALSYRHFILGNRKRLSGVYAGIGALYQSLALEYIDVLPETIISNSFFWGPTEQHIRSSGSGKVETLGYKMAIGYQVNLGIFSLDGGWGFINSYPLKKQNVVLENGTVKDYYSNVHGIQSRVYVSVGFAF